MCLNLLVLGNAQALKWKFLILPQCDSISQPWVWVHCHQSMSITLSHWNRLTFDVMTHIWHHDTLLTSWRNHRFFFNWLWIIFIKFKFKCRFWPYLLMVKNRLKILEEEDRAMGRPFLELKFQVDRMDSFWDRQTDSFWDRQTDQIANPSPSPVGAMATILVLHLTPKKSCTGWKTSPPTLNPIVHPL